MNRFKLIPAVYLLLEKDNKVLLLRRANTGYQDGKLSLVAGHVDGDELATTALLREAKEEIGVDIDVKDLKFVHVAHRLGETSDDERVDFFFSCSRWNGEIQNIEPEKSSELTWEERGDLPDDTIPYIKKVIECINNSISYSEYAKELE